tara:strand:- start:252 stop:416 length:165 start_codon:yes stop_codon:yes gene_type:complete
MDGRVIVEVDQVLVGSPQLLPNLENKPLAKKRKLTQEKICSRDNEKPPLRRGLF